MTTADQRKRMGEFILNYEARRDSNGHLAIYQLPSGDGGGTYEVAGINDRYHPVQAAELRRMIVGREFEEADDYAANYLIEYTNGVKDWHPDAGVEFYLRDCAFNRGPRGAARIFQRALGVDDDGEVGPLTREAAGRATVDQLLLLLRESREQYERDVANRDERSKFWKGLVNRWNKAFDQAQKFSAEAPAVAAGKPESKGWLSALLGWWSGRGTQKPTTIPVAPSAPWIPWAEKEVGFHETGTNRNIGRYTGPAKCGSEGDPWCAIFVNAGFESVGIPGTRSAMARSFEHSNKFVKLAGPAYGAVVTMWRGSLDSGKGHVFFYLGENDKGVVALGGNQDDQVCRQYEPRNRIVGYYWPKSVPLPKIGKIILANVNAKEGSET